MLDYSDKRWLELKGGYGHFYNPVPTLQKLEQGEEIQQTWNELFEELHHQGDVGESAYAALPHLVRIYSQNRQPIHQIYLYGLASVIEVERHRCTNPSVPTWLQKPYFEAWSSLLQLALEDFHIAKEPQQIQAILGVLALAKGAIMLGAIISYTTTSEILEYLDKTQGWSDLYELDRNKP